MAVTCLAGLGGWRWCCCEQVDALKEAAVDFVEVTFKDEFISRADMWRLKRVIGGKAVYLGQTISTLGIRARVKVGTKDQPGGGGGH